MTENIATTIAQCFTALSVALIAASVIVSIIKFLQWRTQYYIDNGFNYESEMVPGRPRWVRKSS